MLLKDFLDKEQIMYQDFAKDLGVSRVYFYHLLSGHRKVSKKMAVKIELLTKGKVTRMEALYPEDFVEKTESGEQLRFSNLPKNNSK